jgi:CheY-like chemotaxis protein/CHASE3 domain sensor protein
MKSSFKRNLLIGFGFSLLLLIVSSVASYISITNLLDSVKLVEHTNKVIHSVENTISILKDAETGQRGFLLTGDERFLGPYTGAYDRAQVELKEVKSLTSDNPVQQKYVDSLDDNIDQRLKQLAVLIEYKKRGLAITNEELEKGRLYMDEARRLVRRMTSIEQALLQERIEQQNKLAGNTPLLIIVAAAMSIVITLVFFVRITGDFNKRTALQKELQEKDEDISRRITLIQTIAEKIAAGDYSVRTKDEGKDGLGSLSISLNKMAESLDYSFNLLSDKEWLQAGIAGLNTEMIGETDSSVLAGKIISFVSGYTNSLVGALYIKETDRQLVYSGGFSFSVNDSNRIIEIGQGIAGQAALTGKTVLINDIEESDILISYATGKAKPKSIIAIPILHENAVTGVFELASLRNYSSNEISYLEAVSYSIGISLNVAENRKRLQELLEETQAQSEELQVQHREMENINEELEVQAQKLQASEEELKVQQEELLQANQELEERSRLLEERNQMILERNHEIQAKAEQLAVSTRYKSEFLANMSHELRTPLNSILLLSRLMSENTTNNLSEDQIEYSKVIQNSGQGLLALINEILDLSKIESGKMDLHLEKVQVEDITAGIASLFRPVAGEKNLAFEVLINPRIPSEITTDRMRLEQIVKNLVSNALKFTSEGHVKLDINLYENNPSLIAFTVEDTGIGIAKEKHHLVFEAFQQEDGSTRRKYGGTGLGLSISRELAKLLGGEITLESDTDKGSRFTLIIPVEPGSAAIVQRKEETETALIPDLSADPEKDVEQRYISTDIPEDVPDDRDRIQSGDKSILIVEDDTNFARSLLEFTRKQGYKGIVCVRGDQVIDIAKKYKPRGILLDIQLPVKDGLEVMDELKSDPLTRHIPVHMMSSHEMKNKSLSKGAVDFINKPMAFEKMRDIFEKLEYVLTKSPQKVLIVEENTKHAKALAYFLETNSVNTEIRNNVTEGIKALKDREVNCVILDMGIPDQKAYDTLEEVKKTPGLESLPIIIFTGKSLSKSEEMRIRQYADSIVIKTAYSYQRIKDEVSLFLHLVEENTKADTATRYKKLGALNEVLKDKTVLVADDDVRNIYSLTRALESFGMNVVSAVDGKEALQKLKETPRTDIILMDMMMPEMDGYETTRAIKKMDDYKRIPVIAVTAKAMLGDREKCIEAGASDYITKPVDIDQLLSLLRVWLYDNKF